jgi:hypothetical protein
MNRENLQKLADGLRGPLRLGFDMDYYVNFSGSPSVVRRCELERELTSVTNDCGTAACACGHATYLIEPKNPGESFSAYSRRVFGLEPEEIGEEWDWCFGSGWSFTDNTPQGAADRIEWLLKHGLPCDAYEQMIGQTPSCYHKEK